MHKRRETHELTGISEPLRVEYRLRAWCVFNGNVLFGRLDANGQEGCGSRGTAWARTSYWHQRDEFRRAQSV